MYCTKCGKELYPGDRFCAHCGSEVRAARPTVYDDIVFNPPFREEARRRTEEITDSFVGFKDTTLEEKKPEYRRETVAFDWGMEKRDSRKIESSDFDWSQVAELGTKRKPLKLEVEQIEPRNQRFFVTEPEKPEVKVVGFAQPAGTIYFEKEEAPMSIEDLEREIFGADDRMLPKKEEKIETLEETKVFTKGGQEKEEPQFLEEKFYTFNQKCDAFDELIQKEKEHLESMGVDVEKTKAVSIQENLPKEEPKEEPFEEIFNNDLQKDELPKEELYHPEFENNEKLIKKDYSYFEMPDPEVPVLEDILEEAEKEKQVKLRYSDVFPRVPVDENGNPVENSENYEPSPEAKVKHEPVVPKIIAENKAKKEALEKKVETTYYNKRPEKKEEERRDLTGIFDPVEIEEDEPKKRHIFAKIIIFILVVLLLCEGVILGVKFVAPDSEFSKWVSEKTIVLIDYGMSIINGENPFKDKGSDNDATGEEANSYKILVDDAAKSSKKIGEITYSSDVEYNKLSKFEFPEVATASEFVDEVWFTDASGNEKTYGQILMSTIVSYFDGWKDINKDESLVGINKLEIGETKIGDTGFYTLARITYAGDDGGEVVKYQTVYTRVSDKSIVINMVKEESI